MPGTRSEPEEHDLTIIDHKDPRPFAERVVPEVVHPPHRDVNRDDIVDFKQDDDHSGSDTDETVTDSEDEFDWEAEDDAKSAKVAASIKAKRGRAVYRAFKKLPRLLRALLVGVIGAGILITPLLVVHLRFSTSVIKTQVYVWSLWLSITWAAGVATFIVVDAVPHFILVLLRLTNFKIERTRVTIEVSASPFLLRRAWLELFASSWPRSEDG